MFIWNILGVWNAWLTSSCRATIEIKTSPSGRQPKSPRRQLPTIRAPPAGIWLTNSFAWRFLHPLPQQCCQLRHTSTYVAARGESVPQNLYTHYIITRHYITLHPPKLTTSLSFITVFRTAAALLEHILWVMPTSRRHDIGIVHSTNHWRFATVCPNK